MRILALDPATKCGFALQDGPSGVWDLSTKRDQSAGMRLVKFKNHLSKLHKKRPFDMVVFEAARNAGFKHQGALVVQAEIQGVLKAWCEIKEIQYTAYSPMTVKKFATGKGNAKKDVMIALAKEHFDEVEIIDDNHADALWILELAIHEFGGGW